MSEVKTREKKRGKKDRPKQKKKRRLAVDEADRYALYQESVQAPSEDVKFFRKRFKESYGRPARVLREDFCGTFWTCCEWVRAHPENLAYGIDLDAEPLDWGRRHNLRELKAKQQERVHIIQGNSLDGGTPPADVVSALNFSYFCFHTRDALREYFRAAHRNLADEGILVIDMHGGWESLGENREEREEDDYTYVWEMESFNAIDHRTKCAIHFEFDDGSTLERAFTYDWRIWVMPEVREILLEAGFRRADPYCEGWDEEAEEGDGVFTLTEEAENCESWIAYVVAVK